MSRCLFLFVLCSGVILQSSYGQKTVDVINNVFDRSTYDKHLRPADTEPFTNVEISLSLARTLSISYDSMSWSTELYLYQRWQDERLAFAKEEQKRPLVGGKELASWSWNPSTYFPMALVDQEQRNSDDQFFKVVGNGTVLAVNRLFLTFPCNNLRRNQISVPDEIECYIRLASFLYGGQDGGVRYSWVQGDKAVATLPTKLDFLDHVFVSESLDQEADGSSYGSISAQVQFRRKVGVICRLLVLPALVCVCVACLAMYLPSKYCVARLALSSISVFFGTALVMIAASRSVQTVDVASLDRFLYGCLVATGLTMLDHLLVTYRVIMSRKMRNKNLQEARDQRLMASQQPYRMVPKHTDHQRLLLQCAPAGEPDNCRSKWRRCTGCLRSGIAWLLAISDWLLRLAVPSFFVVFALHYQGSLFDNAQFESDAGQQHNEQEKNFGVPSYHWT